MATDKSMICIDPTKVSTNWSKSLHSKQKTFMIFTFPIPETIGELVTLNQQKHGNRLGLVEDHIGRSLVQCEIDGEMRTARNFGKPLDLGDGYEQTPAEVRMGYKILKDAGYVPFEVELMRDIEAFKRTVAELPEGDAKRVQQQRLSELRQNLALMLERLKLTNV